LLHDSAHRAIIGQYALIIISQTIELHSMWIYSYITYYNDMITFNTPDSYVVNILLKLAPLF
jgi:hypothetical protein